jgi:hypothetical protein
MVVLRRSSCARSRAERASPMESPGLLELQARRALAQLGLVEVVA